MIVLVLAIALATPAPLASGPAGHDYAHETTTQLIDDLVEVGDEAPGASSLGDFDGFLATDETLEPTVMRTGAQAPVVPGAMRELVRRGPAALGALVAHIDDRRPTHLKTGGDAMLQRAYMDEYEDSDHRFSSNWCFGSDCKHGPPDPVPDDGYTVKVGDLCFTIIGNIVNRRLIATRYQPSGLFFVNSPVHSPALAQRVRTDWGDRDADSLEASLIRDIEQARNRYEANRALVRLKFYFPDAYRSLTGVALERRKAFEARLSRPPSH
jgi:hypothetical protein